VQFAAQVSDWNKRVKRYGMDLPPLARVGFGNEFPPNFRDRAASVCLAHAQGLDRYSQRLTENLGQAMPKPSKRGEQADKAQKPDATRPPVEISEKISDVSILVSRRVHRFLHPLHHTVEVADLRESSLLDSLRSLHLLVADFHDAAARRR
jgi:hypothetical protein